MLIENKSRKEIARELIEEGSAPIDYILEPDPALLPAATAVLAADLALGPKYPPGLAPVPQPINPRPDPDASLTHVLHAAGWDRADVLVVTWTVAELNALADVLTPRHPRSEWYRYRHRFDDHYRPLIREGAPALKANRLGSWFRTTIGGQRVVCFKSELHLNQDGIATGDGTATLPVKDFFNQLIDECRPECVLTVGTAGGVHVDQALGSVAVTQGAKFRLGDEFKNEVFNKQVYRSEWDLPTQYFAKAESLMGEFARNLVEPHFAPPTKRYDFPGDPLPPRENVPRILIGGKEQGGDPFHPILTTDFFEYGTSANHLMDEGCAVEMGDAVLGLACSERANPPKWAVVRNVSDPEINADLQTTPRSLNMQTHWAVWYYEKYGYWTSVNSALATWAIIAGRA